MTEERDSYRVHVDGDDPPVLPREGGVFVAPGMTDRTERGDIREGLSTIPAPFPVMPLRPRFLTAPFTHAGRTGRKDEVRVFPLITGPPVSGTPTRFRPFRFQWGTPQRGRTLHAGTA
jgi:hypothetical protein